MKIWIVSVHSVQLLITYHLFISSARVNVVQWNEDLYEKQLIERTHDACDGLVDIVIDFGTTSRSLHRSMQCLTKGGHVFISDEIAEKLMARFAKRAEERGVFVEVVPTGTIEQLHELVKLVDSGEVCIQKKDRCKNNVN